MRCSCHCHSHRHSPCLSRLSVVAEEQITLGSRVSGRRGLFAVRGLRFLDLAQFVPRPIGTSTPHSHLHPVDVSLHAENIWSGVRTTVHMYWRSSEWQCYLGTVVIVIASTWIVINRHDELLQHSTAPRESYYQSAGMLNK
jgi:hypothetical protein